MHNRCECKLAGYCNRHKMKKTQSMVDSCARNLDMFLHFERLSSGIVEPNIIQKASNFATSAANHAINGFKKVDDITYNDRLNICLSCPLYNSENKSCVKCGCFVEIKCKWSEQSCPENKWLAETNNEKEKKCNSCNK